MASLLHSIGVRGRLLLAFLGISAFAVLGAVAALLAFAEADRVFDRISGERLPAAFGALELSRQAEVIASAAPRLLASTTAAQQMRTDLDIRKELAELDRLLGLVKSGRPDRASLAEIESCVTWLRGNLAQLQELVGTRWHQLGPRRTELLNHIAQVTDDAQWELENWSRQFDLRIAQVRSTVTDSSLSQQARDKALTNLAQTLASARPQQLIRTWFTDIHSGLLQATSASASDLPHVAFNLSTWVQSIDRPLENVDPGLKSRLAGSIRGFRALAEGPDSVPEFRGKELALFAKGEKLLQGNVEASVALTAAANRLVADARAEIAKAEADMAATQRRSAGVLLAVVALSLLSSVMIVWLYVGRSLIARLTALSGSMLAIAGGNLKAPLPLRRGNDEIGQMADALRVFRDTAVEIEEQNLRERQVVLDTIEYGVLILDPDLRVRMYNRAFRELWGLSEEELRDHPFARDLMVAFRNRGVHGIPEAEWDAYVERRMTEIATGESAPQEWQLPGGRVLEYQVVALPDGGRMLTYFDLTRLKQVETELRSAKDEAESRSRELADRVKELRAVGEQLATASKHKSQFLANMSHELRTPLNAILGYTELILDGIYGDAPEKMSSVLERVRANGKHLLNLINDVLDLSKIEAGQLKLSLADYSLDGMIQSVFIAVEPLATEKRLALKLDLARGLPVGRGDEQRLTQVLLNLVGNAIKFTDKGEVVIKAAARNGSFELAVCDTGPGIAAADLTRIFEEFQQADSSSTRPKGGSGLGLSISKRIIEMHGGRLWVVSEIDRGSTFSFTLPVRVDGQAGHA